MRVVIGIAVAVLVLLLLALGGLILYIDRVAEVAIERAGTAALGTETSVGSVAIGLLSGDFSLKGLEVANPPGFEKGAFLSLDGGRANLDLGSLRTDTVRVPEIALDGVTVLLIRSGGKTNYATILESASGTGGRAPAEAEQPGKRFVVEQLRIRDVTARVQLAAAAGKLTELEVKVPSIELENVGTETGGVPLRRLATVVVGAVIDAVMRKRGQLPAELVADLEARLGALDRLPIQLPEGLGRVSGGEQLQEAVEREKKRATEQLEEEAGKALRGLLGGDEPEQK